MRTIELDASGWTKPLDACNTLLASVGAPPGYGRNINALLEAMFWNHAYSKSNPAAAVDHLYAVSPPYTIDIKNAGMAPQNVRAELELIRQCLLDAREEFRRMSGRNVQVQFEIG
jgi:hypothetical protein